MRVVLAVALLLVAFSGCLADDSEETPLPVPSSPPSPSAPASPALTGDASTGATDSPTAPAPAAPPAPEPVRTPFSYDAKTSAYVCLHLGSTPTCNPIADGEADDTPLDGLGAPGALQRVSGNVTWDDTLPTAASITVRLAGQTGAQPATFGEVTGGSPLAFSFDLATFDGSDFRLVLDGTLGQDANLVALLADPGVSVQVEGDLVSSG